PVKEVGQVSGVIARPHHGVEPNAVRNLLLIFFAIEVAERGPLFCPDILKLVPLLKNIIPIAYLGYVQGFAEYPRDVNGYLMRNHMPDFMPQQPSEFVFIFQKGDELPCYIDLAAA